jgi:VIT1/CCC1 family predicted Fe2+/Mn2+ transporter
VGTSLGRKYVVEEQGGHHAWPLADRLSNTDRKAAGVVTGEEVEVEVEIDAEPRVVVEPADFARALDADPAARTRLDRLLYSRKRERARYREREKAETRQRLIEKALAMLALLGRDHRRSDRCSIAASAVSASSVPSVDSGPLSRVLVVGRRRLRWSPVQCRDSQQCLGPAVE